jgi:hypothetical protein
MVDAAPPHAIVGITAEAVGPVKVVRVRLVGVTAEAVGPVKVVRVRLVGVWAYELLGQLVRGKAQCRSQRHDGDVLVLGGHGNGSDK